MKKLFAIFFLITSILSAQSAADNSLLALRNQIEIQTTDQNKFDFTNMPEKKSPMLAIVYSLLLPGMGELYGGGVVGLNVYGDNQKDNYKAYAQSIGRVNVNGKDDQYFADISEYISIEQFNKEQEKYRDNENVYNEDTHYWDWGNNKTRQEYRGMWSKSESAYNNVRFAVGALIVNRIISAINAVRVVAAYNKRLNEENSWNVSVNLQKYSPNMPTSLNLNFNTTF